MSQRAVAILVLVAITVQAMLGGLQGTRVICVGGGHEHSATEVEPDKCALACAHESDWPMLASVDDHDDHCGCVDVELSLIDLLSMRRNAVDCVALAPVPQIILVDLWGTAPVEWRGPPAGNRPDPGGRHRLAVVRTTRMLI